MFVKDKNGEWWADTPSVQAAVTAFNGFHLGFGDFAVTVDGERIAFIRYDGTVRGEAVKAEFNMRGRPHIVSGPEVTIEKMIAILEGSNA